MFFFTRHRPISHGSRRCSVRIQLFIHSDLQRTGQAFSFRGVSRRYTERWLNRRRSDRFFVEKGDPQPTVAERQPLPAIYRGWTSTGSGKLIEPCICGPIVSFCPRGV